MSTSKPPRNIPEYKKWLKDQHHITLDKRVEKYYDTATTYIKNNFINSELWINLIDNLKEFNDEYRIESKGYFLLLEPAETIELFIKPFNSLVNKSFRKNVLNNKNFNEPPSKGWIFPDNWFTRINDIFRTSIVVKYLDGVEFILAKLKSYFEEQCGKKCKSYLEAREEGYYAAHLYFKSNFEIISTDFDTEMIEMSIEIQITTQLQELIRMLLHKYYEERRLRKSNEVGIWQWDYKSNEFATNYLGHILHYIEGMIMDIREKIKKEEIE